MARRNRRATRPIRREPTPGRATSTAETARDATRARTRSRIARPGAALATGEPSPGLERAAALERGHVVKDSRRLGITVGVMLALLVASGLIVNALFP